MSSVEFTRRQCSIGAAEIFTNRKTRGKIPAHSQLQSVWAVCNDIDKWHDVGCHIIVVVLPVSKPAHESPFAKVHDAPI